MNSLLKIDFTKPLNPGGLKAIRRFVGDSQSEASRCVYVSASTWNRWESGSMEPDTLAPIELYLWKKRAMINQSQRSEFDELLRSIVFDTGEDPKAMAKSGQPPATPGH